MSAVSSTDAASADKQRGFQGIISASLAVICLFLVGICLSLALTRETITKVRMPQARTGLCAKSKYHARCVMTVEMEKREYLTHFYRGIWGINLKKDGLSVMFKIRLKGKTEVCASKVRLYEGRVVMIGAKECGHPPLQHPQPEPTGEPA